MVDDGDTSNYIKNYFTLPQLHVLKRIWQLWDFEKLCYCGVVVGGELGEIAYKVSLRKDKLCLKIFATNRYRIANTEFDIGTSIFWRCVNLQASMVYSLTCTELNSRTIYACRMFLQQKRVEEVLGPSMPLTVLPPPILKSVYLPSVVLLNVLL